MAKTYPGRASIAPILDLFQTLLYMGKDGYKKLLHKRQREMVPYFKQELEKVASNHGERLLSSPSNTISYAVSLTFPLQGDNSQSISRSITDFGSMLFLRSVSGCRVIDVSRQYNKNQKLGEEVVYKSQDQTTEYLENHSLTEEKDETSNFVHRVKTKTINGVLFESFGASINVYPTSYFTAACALGMEKEEIDTFVHRLDHVLGMWKAKQVKIGKEI